MRKLAVALALALFAATLTVPAHASPATYFYAAHVQNVGWQDPVWDGAGAGTTGKSLRLEALRFSSIGQVARGHVQNLGWQEWRAGDVMIGTTGKSLRLEAVEIRSTVEGQKIRCQAHVQNIGWMAPVEDGETCGTTGRSLRLEAVRLWLVPVTPPPPPAPEEPVLSTIATVGDVGLEAAGLNTLSAMGAANPTLTFLLGDLSYGTAAQPFCDAVKARIPGPFGWVQGNHETVPDSDGPLTADFLACLPATPGASGNPAIEQVIEIPGARIITASPQEGIGYLPGSAGYQRISDAIDAANAAGVWPILAMHEPHVTVGLHGSAGPESKALSELAVAKGVPLVLTSHDHNYSRSVIGGTTFIVAGMGGHNVRGLNPSSPWWPQTIVAFPGTPGYLALTIREHSITGQTMPGSADKFDITRPGGS